MKKLIKGIVDFRKNIRPGYRETFAKLALGQSPDTLFIACSDSRVVPNLFASTEPGDLFVIRNVGNLVPPCGDNAFSTSDESEIAALEFSISQLKISNIIVCGHSECGAMIAVSQGRDKVAAPHLKAWLRHADATKTGLDSIACSDTLSGHNQISQKNVILQMEHLKSYPVVKEKIKEGVLKIHGWWFDIAQAEVYAFEPDLKKFVLIDEVEATRLLEQLDK